MIYVTSDTFFGRSSKAKDRGFANSEEMQTELIKRWNEKVKPTDIVYHLGNFAWDIVSSEHALMNLNGVINLMPSTYDEAAKESFEMFENAYILDVGIQVIESLECVLSPWPLRTWPGKPYSILHIHGGDKRFKANLLKENRFNANCDLWSLSPVSLDSLKEVLEMVEESK